MKVKFIGISIIGIGLHLCVYATYLANNISLKIISLGEVFLIGTILILAGIGAISENNHQERQRALIAHYNEPTKKSDQ